MFTNGADAGLAGLPLRQLAVQLLLQGGEGRGENTALWGYWRGGRVLLTCKRMTSIRVAGSLETYCIHAPESSSHSLHQRHEIQILVMG